MGTRAVTLTGGVFKVPFPACTPSFRAHVLWEP